MGVRRGGFPACKRCHFSYLDAGPPLISRPIVFVLCDANSFQFRLEDSQSYTNELRPYELQELFDDVTLKDTESI